MKPLSKIILACTLTLLLGMVGVSVWAAPRLGTVPVPPPRAPVAPLIPVTGGTYQVTLSDDCKAKGDVTRITDPTTAIGKPPEGLSYLSDSGKLTLGSACNVQICYPYPSDIESKSGQIYSWNGSAWVVLISTVSGNPKMICTTVENTTGLTFGLIGK